MLRSNSSRKTSFRQKARLMKKLGFILLSLAILSGCTSQPAQQEQKQPPESVTGRTAFQKLFVAARGWGSDARPYQLQSQVFGDAKGTDGKAAVWRAAFGSAAQHGSRQYVWSGVDSPDAPSRGVTPGSPDSYTPGNTFDVNFLKVDTDKAYEVAQKHGGDKITNSPVTYMLEWEPGENKLLWRVIYGASRNDAKLVVDVDATTGEFNRKEK
jgi:hypothetical protein